MDSRSQLSVILIGNNICRSGSTQVEFDMELTDVTDLTAEDVNSQIGTSIANSIDAFNSVGVIDPSTIDVFGKGYSI